MLYRPEFVVYLQLQSLTFLPLKKQGKTKENILGNFRLNPIHYIANSILI